ncbi:polygalacturonase inhibitor-like [Iris pallida]|uniref:Polygalacturonase inhibitor-like n=1 Tax=Iris pallida TaxID=29817 RepID=A0AAX6HVV2_IRIPA|nr:polygalacturonase inhibitor-like [Iris pallida]
MYAALTLSTLLLISTLFSSSHAACNKQDEAALLAFKNSFLYTTLKWPQPADCCSWDHVGCDSSNGRVVSLSFENDNNIPESIFLNGSIPSSVGDLSSLETLSFKRITSLVGPVPPQLSKLKKLRSLQIYVTRVSGPVPSFLSQLASLQQLELGANAFSGAIPPSLGDLARLTDLNMFGNQLTGPIPASLFSKLPIGSLATLVLSANKLTGTIPRSFADVAFTALYLQHNSLNGDASFLFGKSKPLSQIDLASNRLAFDLSRTEFPLNMNVMDISNNKIYGSIPSQITELPNLSFIDVSYNRLCGKIPSGGNVNFSSQSYVHNKCLCGAPLQPCK